MSMSKKYDRIYNFPIIFTNVPIQKKPQNDSISFKTTINTSGWDILFKKLKNRSVYIDLNAYANNNSVNFSNTKSIVQEQFSDITIKEVDPSFFVLNFENLETNTFPVHINMKEKFPPNYYITYLKIEPDSIHVTGNKETLKKTNQIESSLFTVTEKDSLISNISLLENKEINLGTKTVDIHLKVEEFVEKEFVVPVRIENNTDNVDIIIYPQEIALKCLVPIRIYENILASDFYISADFNNIEVRNDNRLILNIKGKPESVKNIQLGKEKVEYIIYQ